MSYSSGCLCHQKAATIHVQAHWQTGGKEDLHRTGDRRGTEAAVSGEEDLHVEDSEFDFEEDIAIREINKVLGGDEDADSDYESDFEDESENAKMIDKFSQELV